MHLAIPNYYMRQIRGQPFTAEDTLPNLQLRSTPTTSDTLHLASAAPTRLLGAGSKRRRKHLQHGVLHHSFRNEIDRRTPGNARLRLDPHGRHKRAEQSLSNYPTWFASLRPNRQHGKSERLPLLCSGRSDPQRTRAGGLANNTLLGSALLSLMLLVIRCNCVYTRLFRRQYERHVPPLLHMLTRTRPW